MGAGIHWFIERRARNRRWHVVDSERRLVALRWDDRRRSDGSYRPGYTIGSRDYALFAVLSGVRGPALDRGPLLRAGVPDDASDHVKAEASCFGGDAHHWGWATGEQILAWSGLPSSSLTRWIDQILDHLADGPMDEVIPSPVSLDLDRVYPDQIGTETGHEAMERARLSQGLLDWSRDPGAWRIILFYDS